MDVFVKDSNRTFNLEIQTGDYDSLILRARYYQSASDVATTKRRTKFNNLKESFIVFICVDDPFGQKLPVYTRKTTFLQTDWKFCQTMQKHALNSRMTICSFKIF